MSETIRRGTEADVASVHALSRSSPMAPRWELIDFAMIFRTPRVFLIAEWEGKLAGFIVGHDISGEWELENVVVADEFRSRGLGQRLVWELILQAKRNKAEAIFLEVRESNAVARHLYERCGFQQYGCRKAYYSNPPEDAILYRFLCNRAALEIC